MDDNLSYLSNASVTAIEQLYQQYLENPESVDPGWKKFFEGFDFARSTYHESDASSEIFSEEFNVINLINAYRQRGHLFTKTNPVRQRRQYTPNLDIENFGLKKEHLETVFKAGSEIGMGPAKLKDIIVNLEKTYCQSIGVEYLYIRQPEKVAWIKNKLEKNQNTPTFTEGEKKHILFKLNQAVGFEQFIQRKYIGQKRFSLEGAEALIPAMDAIIEKGAEAGISDFVFGMAHRGRLNVLANIMNKASQDIFNEFEGSEYEDRSDHGDVKYHLGYSSEVISKSGHKVRLSLSPNPSHLETVDPVVEGIARARIDQEHQGNSSVVLPVIIHGDAAIAGQGVVYEVIQMADLKGFGTGGTIHLVVNNQVGFTTNYLDARTSTYCTDVAKTTLCPVFHVNGDDPEALVHTIQIAMEYRQKFKSDVFVDLLCYRKYGHNEGDEPRFTQPLLYKIIEKHPDPLTIYAAKLIEEGVISADDLTKLKTNLNEHLSLTLEEARKVGQSRISPIFSDQWQHIHKAKPEDFEYSPDTSVSEKNLKELGNKITSVPAEMNLFNKTVRLLESRKEMLRTSVNFDWGMAEHLAFASILQEGFPIRFTGQDVERGTFSHRHAVITLEDSEEKYVPLNHISTEQAPFNIYNSLLSEYGVLGYDYGYSMVHPDTLTIWEAQFGDFANGAQIIFDQYISSSEEKWKLTSNLVVLLPHGYEGQGPEHSSARIERFLTLTADLNMQVVYCSTPANYFHLIRRQIHRPFRKPLIVFTPKSLLRNPECVSDLSAFTSGGFRELIDDVSVSLNEVQKVVLCTGKVYYDLELERKKLGNKDTALVRLEQLYPLPYQQLKALKEKYKHVKTWLWVQEEPENMGAWPFIYRKLPDFNFRPIARSESASPASGLFNIYQQRQRKIIDDPFSE
jgi:2-oxoglutarate dehydrogenase E1 component